MIKILILLTIFLLNHLQSYFINGISIFITSFIVFYKVFNIKMLANKANLFRLC